MRLSAPWRKMTGSRGGIPASAGGWHIQKSLSDDRLFFFAAVPQRGEEMHPPFSFRLAERPLGEMSLAQRIPCLVPLRSRGVEPPFSFRLAEKKTAVHGQKKRRFCPNLTALGQVWGCVVLARNCRKKTLTEALGAGGVCQIFQTIATRMGIAQSGVSRIYRCFYLRAFRFARRCRVRNRITPGREIQRGGAVAPPLCVVRGCGGEIETPPRFWRGMGRCLFAKDITP